MKKILREKKSMGPCASEKNILLLCKINLRLHYDTDRRHDAIQYRELTSKIKTVRVVFSTHVIMIR